MSSKNSNIDTLKVLIEKCGSSSFDIVYGKKFFFNHTLHGLIALHKLHASDERLQEFFDIYTKLLNPPVPLNPDDPPLTETNWTDYLGKEKRFVELADYFERVKRELGDKKKLLQKYLPKLIDGISGEATHGIIHLGYALHSPDEKSLSDALAALTWSYRYLGHLGMFARHRM
ncbi:unnamed protein product [Didymodactylos carnosus]|uniref:Uncharacterized protein n=1 Tax=Didymodactylos carnosus TaxID=1234261 RepID=A0A816BKA2_9BILA|nr:unnamed protein product [Didymodactylos carnosus]CAF4496623.1 unnamed protein product [Didymodactylos carnosus]